MSADSARPYDALAPHYREYASTRSAYLDAVDRFVAERVPAGSVSLLDVGAGDGIRAMAIARAQGISEVILCEPSSEMAKRCQMLGPSQVWEFPAETIPDTNLRFDVITCLWNVLGHLEGSAARLRALCRIRALIRPHGRLFIDVNNRHNAAAYGWLRVLGRIVLDAVSPDERRGDAQFDWQIAGRLFPAMGHLFTPAEARGLFERTGFRLLEWTAIDYANGKRSRSPFMGQLVYMLAPDG
jgi:2-polyprenyl-3-methyl-5-hydroxy-6-metoxy-1,4-benzoquinol methylase